VGGPYGASCLSGGACLMANPRVLSTTPCVAAEPQLMRPHSCTLCMPGTLKSQCTPMPLYILSVKSSRKSVEHITTSITAHGLGIVTTTLSYQIPHHGYSNIAQNRKTTSLNLPSHDDYLPDV